MRGRLLLVSLFASSLFLSGPALAVWQPNGTGISTTLFAQTSPAITPDGNGGAIIVWQDTRSGTPDIYAQRVDRFGVPQWTTDGVAVCTASGIQTPPLICSDGAGGAIIAWADSRVAGYDIYAQRINSAGVTQWTFQGVALCMAANTQSGLSMVADGSGGAVMAWMDGRNGVDDDIYAQRVNGSGTALWTANGVAVCTAAGYQQDVKLTTDGSGGAIMTWNDYRNATVDIYARRVNGAGTALWAANGVAICTATGDQWFPSIVYDGSGGAYIAWHDLRIANMNIYTQRVNASGITQFTTNGTVVCSDAANQYNVLCASDGAGGAIFAWLDERAPNVDVYAQRINPLGAVQWNANGVAVSATTGDQAIMSIVPDGAGGAFMAWQDWRSAASTGIDIYAQRIDETGTAYWASHGIPVCNASTNQLLPVLTTDSDGNLLAAWQDDRAGNTDVYAQRIEGTYGQWGHPEPAVTSVADVPNDQGGKVAVNWDASGRDRPVQGTIAFYSVWRAVDMAALPANAAPPVSVASQITEDTPPGVLTAFADSPYYWELVATQTAFRWAHYSISASTRADSIASNAGDEFFMVAAHDKYDEQIAFPSNEMSGHSVDNLAPAAPLALTAQRFGTDVHLAWKGVTAPDLLGYSVYRAGSSGVTPVPVNFIADSEDTVLVDTGVPSTALYYIVTARDVHGNKGPASNEAAISSPTGAGGTPPITALTVLPNHPNPFSDVTNLEVGLPARADVHVEIYDVAGRRVTAMDVTEAEAGWRSIAVTARDARGRALASGVYFCRVKAGPETVTRKIVIAR